MRCRLSLALPLALAVSLGAHRVVMGDPSTSTADTPVRVKPRAILHIRIQGDIDSAKLADEFARHVAESRQPNGTQPLLLLELDGRKWRTDVLLSIAKVIRNEQSPIASVVYLNNPGTGVGTGQASLGLIADACYLSPRTKIVWEPADDARALCPDGFDADAAERELRGLAWTAVQERGRDALLTTLVPRPTSALYAFRQSSEDSPNTDRFLKLSTTPPERGAPFALIPPFGEKGPPPARFDSDAASRIGLVSGVAGSISDLLTKRSIRAGKRVDIDVQSGLTDARISLQRSMREIDEARRQAGAAIDEVYRYRTPDQVSHQRRVGTEQGPLIEVAKKRLEQVESITQTYPELLRAPPPGATIVAQTTQTLQRAWHDLFQSRRLDLDRLADRAKTLAEKQISQP